MSAVQSMHRFLSHIDQETRISEHDTPADAALNNAASTMMHVLKAIPLYGLYVAASSAGDERGKKTEIVSGVANLAANVAAVGSLLVAPELAVPIWAANMIMHGAGAGKDVLDMALMGSAWVFDVLKS